VGLAYTKDSAYAQERVKHEALHTDLGPPGRPYEYREYPKRLYKAKDAQGREFDAVDVGSETEEQNMLSRGFRAGRDHAIEALLARQKDVAEAAANRAWHEQRMSEKARREAAEADDATPNHLPVVPEKPRPPRRKPGPKPKEARHAEA